MVFHGPGCLAIRLLALEGLALIVEFLAVADADLEFEPPVLEVEPGRDQGQSFLLDLLDDLADFVTLQQQLETRS